MGYCLGAIFKACAVDCDGELVARHLTAFDAVKLRDYVRIELGFQLVNMLCVVVRIMGNGVALDGRTACREAHDEERDRDKQEHRTACGLDFSDKILACIHGGLSFLVCLFRKVVRYEHGLGNVLPELNFLVYLVRMLVGGL